MSGNPLHTVMGDLVYSTSKTHLHNYTYTVGNRLHWGHLKIIMLIDSCYTGYKLDPNRYVKDDRDEYFFGILEFHTEYRLLLSLTMTHDGNMVMYGSVANYMDMYEIWILEECTV